MPHAKGIPMLVARSFAQDKRWVSMIKTDDWFSWRDAQEFFGLGQSYTCRVLSLLRASMMVTYDKHRRKWRVTSIGRRARES